MLLNQEGPNMKVFGVLMVVAAAAVAAEKKIDPVANQLQIFRNSTKGPIGIITTTAGIPVSYESATCTLNKKLLLNDFFMEMNVHHLLRERTPERVVHALGTGAFGYFIVTHDISHICKANFLNKIGKKTPIAMRFSTSAGSRGSSEMDMDTRGISVKWYTEEGNFDMAGFNCPLFSIKDPMHAHAVIHAPRRNPATNVPDPTMSWDRFTQIPETLHMMLYVFSGRGLPASYRHMPGWGIHTYQVVNEQGETHFLRFSFVPQAGTKNLKAKEAEKLRATDPNYLTKDLYRAISEGNFPKWDVCVQILTVEDVEKEGSLAFDVTRTLPENLYPPQKIGELCLTRNPKNHFAEIEQLAFFPGNVVPGILGAPDKIYEARCLIYKTAQLIRLGKNFNNIEVNCPFRVKAVHTYHRDGAAPFGDNGGSSPNYYPNSFNGPVPYRENKTAVLIDIIETKAYNFDQAGDLYQYGLNPKEKTTLVENLVSVLKTVMDPIIQKRAVTIFTEIHPHLGSRITKGLNSTK